MRVLVDTNIWIDHFQKTSDALVGLLLDGRVLLHPFVRGELALGQFKHREMVMEFLAEMPVARELMHEETLALIEARKLMGRGIGLIDTMLLGSALVTPECLLWTADKRLAMAAEECGVAFSDG